MLLLLFSPFTSNILAAQSDTNGTAPSPNTRRMHADSTTSHTVIHRARRDASVPEAARELVHCITFWKKNHSEWQCSHACIKEDENGNLFENPEWCVSLNSPIVGSGTEWYFPPENDYLIVPNIKLPIPKELQ